MLYEVTKMRLDDSEFEGNDSSDDEDTRQSMHITEAMRQNNVVPRKTQTAEPKRKSQINPKEFDRLMKVLTDINDEDDE